VFLYISLISAWLNRASPSSYTLKVHKSMSLCHCDSVEECNEASPLDWNRYADMIEKVLSPHTTQSQTFAMSDCQVSITHEKSVEI
jgi:hypothetical protein